MEGHTRAVWGGSGCTRQSAPIPGLPSPLQAPLPRPAALRRLTQLRADGAERERLEPRAQLAAHVDQRVGQQREPARHAQRTLVSLV
jgi:hypothetical protein